MVKQWSSKSSLRVQVPSLSYKKDMVEVVDTQDLGPCNNIKFIVRVQVPLSVINSKY